jgi:aromatic amino acid aminotransferase I
MDEDGMTVESLREQTLRARQRGLNPDLVYLVPTAQNPTGRTMSEQRKRDIYQACCELDLIVIEDDAYYYLHFTRDEKTAKDGIVREDEKYALKNMPGIHGLPRSMFSMDREGRVLRLDSLSKSIAPGMRLGWVAGPQDFVDKYQLLQEQTAQVLKIHYTFVSDCSDIMPCDNGSHVHYFIILAHIFGPLNISILTYSFLQASVSPYFRPL